MWPVLACLLLVACDFNDDAPTSGAPGGASPPAGTTPPGGSPPPPGNPPPDTNRPPLISGSPSTLATVGQAWSFQPSISDPDGDRLTVTASNLPGWITLTPSTGRLEGTPAEGDVRSWEGIVLTVSDGQASATLSGLSVNVQAAGAATGFATLNWSAPTERIDGSPIGELVGYRVLYGQVSRNYDHTVELDNAGITRYVVEGLGAGTWYFAIQAVTSDGLVSEPSAEASKTI